MAKSLDKVLVVDIECTCWETVPRGETNEIIEVGLVVLDTRTLTTVGESIIVKPTTSTISEFCTQLTTLTPEYVADKGISFSNACMYLTRHYESARYTFASWGDYDRRQFTRQCEREGIEYPFSPTHLNIKNLFALKYKLQKEVGMMEALDIAGISHTGTHHRGFDDAVNITKLLIQLLT